MKTDKNSRDSKRKVAYKRAINDIANYFGHDNSAPLTAVLPLVSTGSYRREVRYRRYF